MIALTHPIKQMINSQYGFLSSMLERFPSLLNEWIKRQEEEVEQLAREYAEGDYEVYRDTYNSEKSRVDPCYDEELLFNQAMLIMVYSYYESFLCRLAKESGLNVKTDARPSSIANKHNGTIEGEFLKISTFLHDTILPLRNELCHNNNGTLYSREEDNERAIVELERKGYISMGNDGISIIDRNFIKQVLDGEHKLLLKLADICGYKTTLYGYKDGSDSMVPLKSW
jgi:hypothetical protein